MPNYKKMSDQWYEWRYGDKELTEESVNESKTSDMMKAIRKHGTVGPWILIVSKNNKVVSQVTVKKLKEIPAYLAALRPRYPNHKIGIESKGGKIVYREEISKVAKSQHLSWLLGELKDYEDEVKEYIKELNKEGEKKMAIELMKLYKRHLIEFKIGLEKIYK